MDGRSTISFDPYAGYLNTSSPTLTRASTRSSGETTLRDTASAEVQLPLPTLIKGDDHYTPIPSRAKSSRIYPAVPTGPRPLAEHQLGDHRVDGRLGYIDTHASKPIALNKPGPSSPTSPWTFERTLQDPSDSGSAQGSGDEPSRFKRIKKRFPAIFWHLVFVGLMCGVYYLVFHVALRHTHALVLTKVRLIIGIAGALFGTAIGYTLTKLAEPWLEAAVWTYIIQRSDMKPERHMKASSIKTLTEDSGSVWHALCLIRKRSKTEFWDSKKAGCSPAYWTTGIIGVLFFLLLLAISSSINLVLGRAVYVQTITEHSHNKPSQTVVAGDVSAADISGALAQMPAITNFDRTWTFRSAASQADQPGNASLPMPVNLVDLYGVDTVYFSEISTSQLVPGGSGLGVFDVNGTVGRSALDAGRARAVDPSQSLGHGSLLQFPRWGIRIHCQKLPDPLVNLIPESIDNFSYIFLTRDLIRSLYASFNLSIPLDVDNAVFDPSTVMSANDQMPVNLNASDVLYGTKFWNSGYGHQLWSVPTNNGDDGNGWASIESVLVRLNTTYVPSSVFPVYSPPVPDADGNPTRIGYDTAVCLRLIEPWVVETYNSTVSSPTSLRIVDKANSVADVGRHTDAAPSLNSTGKFSVYTVAHDNSVNQIVKDNGRDAFYVPSPTVVSFTDGYGPEGYIELLPSRFADARAVADSTNLLPYLVGSGSLVAQSYKDRTYATTKIVHYILGPFAGLLLALGAAARWIPRKLPHGVAPRNFKLYTMMQALYAGQLEFDDPSSSKRVRRDTELKDVKAEIGAQRMRFVV